MIPGLAIFAVLIVLYAALAVKLGRWSITMPMVFVVVGFVLGPGVLNLLPMSPSTETVKGVTEITLALLLFADASTLKLEEVADDAALPARLLTIGLLLTMVLGGSSPSSCCRRKAWPSPSCWAPSWPRPTRRSACRSSTTRGCRCASGGR